MIDKKIHEKEFRLRIMLTDSCNKDCDECLNEFQPKGTMYNNCNLVDPYKAMALITNYVHFCNNMKIQPILSLTGGEPSIHPYFIEIVNHAKKYKSLKTQVNTNGAVDCLYWDNSGVDVRYHVGPGLNNKIIEGQTAVYVIKESDTVNEVIEFLAPFSFGGMKIKTFADFHASDTFCNSLYPEMLKEINKCFYVSGRHTGIQINRGDGCYNCEKKCITLKALWLFPDNTCSPCPQRREFFNKDIDTLSIFHAYNFHLR
jgi:hypothetical protein